MKTYKIDIDDLFESQEFFVALSYISDNKNSHSLEVKANSEKEAADIIGERLKPFFYQTLLGKMKALRDDNRGCVLCGKQDTMLKGNICYNCYD